MSLSGRRYTLQAGRSCLSNHFLEKNHIRLLGIIPSDLEEGIGTTTMDCLEILTWWSEATTPLAPRARWVVQVFDDDEFARRPMGCLRGCGGGSGGGNGAAVAAARAATASPATAAEATAVAGPPKVWKVVQQFIDDGAAQPQSRFEDFDDD